MNLKLPFLRKMRQLSCWERTFNPQASDLRHRAPHHSALTLVEMLIAMAIALLMMAAVVTVFANISASVTRRRATIEMSGQLRGAREMLSRDLEGATCPAIPWQKPDAAHGYFELIEGPLNDSMPSVWLWDSADSDQGAPDQLGNARLDLGLSFLPGSNLRDTGTSTDEEGRGLALGSNERLDEDFKTDGRGLGDGDDILMLTVRNETDQFVGRVPPRIGVGSPRSGATMPNWGVETLQSSLAEVVWFSVENPPEANTTFAFGEPGFRTIYRRTLLIAPWLEYNINVTGGGRSIVTEAGIVRVLRPQIDQTEVDQALASLVAFQESYDLSVRLEWDPLMPSNNGGRWVLKANSLADLTKRENRYEHHGYVFNNTRNAFVRQFPFAAASFGAAYGTNDSVRFVIDPDYANPTAVANFDAIVNGQANNGVLDYQPDNAETLTDILNPNRRYPIRPFAFANANTGTAATARAWRNNDGNVVLVTRGLVPLSGARQGEDIVMTDVLAFDLRVYDPGAPLYGYYPLGYGGGNNQAEADLVVQPGDPAWQNGVTADLNGNNSSASTNRTDLGDLIAPVDITENQPFRWERNGAYVDLGYDRTFFNTEGLIPSPFNRNFISRIITNSIARANPTGIQQSPRFFVDGTIETTNFIDLAPGYSVYDTWSWHYENNGINEDGDFVLDANGNLVLDANDNPIPAVDEAVNGLDDIIRYRGVPSDVFQQRYGADDPSERETSPPYDTALRGVQAKIRVYERDSRQIRETTIRESFVPE